MNKDNIAELIIYKIYDEKNIPGKESNKVYIRELVNESLVLYPYLHRFWYYVLSEAGKESKLLTFNGLLLCFEHNYPKEYKDICIKTFQKQEAMIMNTFVRNKNEKYL